MAATFSLKFEKAHSGGLVDFFLVSTNSSHLIPRPMAITARPRALLTVTSAAGEVTLSSDTSGVNERDSCDSKEAI